MFRRPFAFVLITSTLSLVGACIGATENPADDAPEIQPQSAGGTGGCGGGSGLHICHIGSEYGTCATDLLTNDPVCCFGCVDGDGYCRDGQWGTECGAGGVACQVCAAGRTCSAGACVSNCLADIAGTSCTARIGKGVYGNGANGTCVCCTGCFDPNSGLCVTGTDWTDCGGAGAMCTQCGGTLPNCVNHTCSP